MHTEIYLYIICQYSFDIYIYGLKFSSHTKKKGWLQQITSSQTKLQEMIEYHVCETALLLQPHGLILALNRSVQN